VRFVGDPKVCSMRCSLSLSLVLMRGNELAQTQNDILRRVYKPRNSHSSGLNSIAHLIELKIRWASLPKNVILLHSKN